MSWVWANFKIYCWWSTSTIKCIWSTNNWELNFGNTNTYNGINAPHMALSQTHYAKKKKWIVIWFKFEIKIKFFKAIKLSWD